MNLREANQYSLKTEVLLLWKYRKLVVGLTTGVIALAIAYVLVVPPEYLSTAELIPPSFKQVKSLNFLKSRFEGFGTAEEEDLERLTASLKSDSAFYHITRKLNLEKHYGVDDISDKGARTKALRNKYESNITVRVTGFSTVQITVYDEVPETAAAIANEFITYANDFAESVAGRKAGIRELERSIRHFETEHKKLQDTLAKFRSEYRLYHLDNMSETFSQQIALDAFKKPQFSANYDRLLSGEHRLRYYDDMIANMENELAFRKENLATYPQIVDVVNKGTPSYVRARPKRLPIVAVGAVLGFLLSSFIVLVWKRSGARESNL